MSSQDKRAEISLSQKLVGTDRPADLRESRTAMLREFSTLGIANARGKLILDGGCGPAAWSIILSEMGNTVVGIDISREALGVAKKRATARSGRFFPVTGDLEFLPFKDQLFDVCLCLWTVHHFPDVRQTVAELVRVLKPGGVVAIIEPNGSNLAVALSTRLEGLASSFLERHGLDTPNESIHSHRYYASALAQSGLSDVVITSHYFGGLPPLPRISFRGGGLRLMVALLIHFAVRVRRLVYLVLSRTLPSPYGGADLSVRAVRDAVTTQRPPPVGRNCVG